VSLPRPVPLPTLDEGPHLSYAGQWLLFTLLAGLGWGALVRRHGKLARQQARKLELRLEAERTGAPSEVTAAVTAASALTPARHATTNGDRPTPGDGATTTERPGTSEP